MCCLYYIICTIFSNIIDTIYTNYIIDCIFNIKRPKRFSSHISTRKTI
nr:MAG TPA: hypothetical protein [Inoviridae sp.]